MTEESGGDGYGGGYGNYDNGSHSASLVGVYASESLAERHANRLREEEEIDEDEEEDGPKCERRSVVVVQAPVATSMEDNGTSNIWSFEADTDLEPPCNYR